MKTTTFICDVCKKSVLETDLTEMRVTIVGRNKTTARTYSMSREVKKDICLDCLKKKNLAEKTFLEVKQDQETEDKNTATLESKLIEILQEIGVMFEE